MKILLLLSLISPILSQAQWKAVTYEKVILPNHTPEAVILTKNESAGTHSYSISYQIGGKIVATRALPTEMYIEMKNKFSHEVLRLAKADVKGSCARHFEFEEGTYEASPDKSNQTKAKTNIRYCLNATKQTRAAEDAFARWYQNARALLGL